MGKVPNINPLEDRVICRRVEMADMTEGGIHVPITAKEKQMEAIVVAVGPGKAAENGTIITPAVKPGDRVLMPKFVGSEIESDGVVYTIVRETEILAVFV